MKLLLIDSRVNYNTLIEAKKSDVEYYIFDYENDTYSSIVSGIAEKFPEVPFLDIALVQHAESPEKYVILQKESPIYLNSSDMGHLDSFKEFLINLKASCHVLNFDMLACVLYYHIEFINAIHYLENETSIDLGASSNFTGNPPNGDWVMETDNVNIRDKYFTDAIENFTELLATYTLSTTGGFNNATDNQAIYQGWFKSAKTQMIYLASELSAMGMGSGVINSISFFVQALNLINNNGGMSMRLYLNNTTSSSFASNNNYLSMGTQVYEVNNYNVTLGKNTHVLSPTFTWDGTSNIVLTIVSTINTQYTQNASSYYYASGGAAPNRYLTGKTDSYSTLNQVETAFFTVGDSILSFVFQTEFDAGPPVPFAPANLQVVKGNAQATVSFSAPSNTSSVTPTGYVIVTEPATSTVNTTNTSATLTGLTNGTSYVVKVYATSANGNGVIATSTSFIPGTPTAPQNLTVQSFGDGQAVLTLSPPTTDNGFAITSYTIRSSPDNITVTGASTSLTITGLRSGIAYTFTAYATNANGNGEITAATSPITMYMIPSNPQLVNVLIYSTYVVIQFNPPAINGEGVTYEVRNAEGTVVASNSQGNMTFNNPRVDAYMYGLTNFTTYTFTVYAKNSAGYSSGLSVQATPASTTTYIVKLRSTYVGSWNTDTRVRYYLDGVMTNSFFGPFSVTSVSSYARVDVPDNKVVSFDFLGGSTGCEGNSVEIYKNNNSTPVFYKVGFKNNETVQLWDNLTPMNINAKCNGNNIIITYQAQSSAFPISKYIIESEDGTLLGQSTLTTTGFNAVSADKFYRFKVKAVVLNTYLGTPYTTCYSGFSNFITTNQSTPNPAHLFNYYRIVGKQIDGKSGLMQLTELQLNGRNATQTTAVRYPSAALTSATATTQGTNSATIASGYDAGTYIVSSSVGSSAQYGTSAIMGFNHNNGDAFFSLEGPGGTTYSDENVGTSSGSFPRSNRITFYQGSTLPIIGEWFQIQMPVAMKLDSFSIFKSGARFPNAVYILGSNNGSTWTLIHEGDYFGVNRVFYSTVSGSIQVANYTLLSTSTNEFTPVAFYSAAIPCLTKGTCISTPNGSRLVEALKSGDHIMTADGREVPIQIYSTKVVATPKTAPYHIPGGAFGASQPNDITLSPKHAFQCGKNIWQIPEFAAKMNSSIRQVQIGEVVEYYHIKTPNYFTDNIIANGNVVEALAKDVKLPEGQSLYKWCAKRGGFERYQPTELKMKTITI